MIWIIYKTKDTKDDELLMTHDGNLPLDAEIVEKLDCHIFDAMRRLDLVTKKRKLSKLKP